MLKRNQRISIRIYLEVLSSFDLIITTSASDGECVKSHGRGAVFVMISQMCANDRGRAHDLRPKQRQRVPCASEVDTDHEAADHTMFAQISFSPKCGLTIVPGFIIEIETCCTTSQPLRQSTTHGVNHSGSTDCDYSSRDYSMQRLQMLANLAHNRCRRLEARIDKIHYSWELVG